MKKYLGLLEGKVEWIALAAGVAFMGYMVWIYVVNPPVHAQIAGQPATPGEIDGKILDTVGTKLDNDMKRTDVGQLPKPQSFVEAFKAKMNFADAPPASAGDALVLWPQTPPIKFSDMPSAPSSPGTSTPTGPAVATGSGTVEKLPAVPAPQVLATKTDMSYVLPAGQTLDPSAPVPTTGGVDKTWVSILYSIDASALTKQWEQAKLPSTSSNTAFLQVYLQRQELKPDGTWSDPVDLQPLIVSSDPVPAAPASSKATPDALGYITWADAHQKDILRPGFYAIVKGKKWSPPGTDSDLAQQQDVKFDPTKYLDAKDNVLMTLTPDQRLQVSAARSKRAADAAKARTKTAPRSSAGGGSGAPAAPGPDSDVPGMGGGSPGPNDPGRPNYILADPAANGAAVQTPAAPKAPQPQAKPGGPSPIAQLVAGSIPAGEFDPSTWNTDHPNQPTIVGWAHDDTVQPGHTYRYRVIYRVKNPVAYAQSAVKNPALADQLDIRSEPSEWSGNVDVRSAVNFWLVRASDTNSSAAVEIFRWQSGEAKHKVFNITPGDAIGGKDGNIDFSTGWTLVDVRGDARTGKAYVLLMDPSGVMLKRDPDTDAASPKYQELKQQSGSVTMAH